MAIQTRTGQAGGAAVSQASLEASDPEIWSLLQRDRQRHNETLNFIASENYASPAVLEALASHLNAKYAEGYPNARYYQGVALVDDVETLAIERAKALFGAEHANVQPHSGSTANMAAYYGLLELGDTILGMDLSHGGHLTHGSPVSFSGKQFKFVSYHVAPDTEVIDYDEVARLAREHKPKLIVAGASAYPRIIDFARFREIADEVGALFMADIAHIAGLVAAGVHPSPVPYADVVTTTTHKSLRGPRGGLILCQARHAKGIDRAVFPMLQGGPILGAVAARAVCFREAMQPEFKTYSELVVRNARALAEGLRGRGLSLMSGGTDNHLLVVKLLDRPYTGAKLAEVLERAGIITSKSTVPGETRSPRQTSGVRFGTPAITTRGATEEHLRQIGGWVADIAEDPDDEARIDEVRGQVRRLAAALQQI
ncbi:MAG: serine hydroxymethyltransferase [Chloroflexota bacterium]|nr:serine hydroxymethyltransferase [Chloroflexota bacterium]